MDFAYVPLLQIQRGIQDVPPGMGRFWEYLRTVHRPRVTVVSDRRERHRLVSRSRRGRDRMSRFLPRLRLKL